jgi:transcriptional regulator with XRE-family HTH domain
METIDLKAFRKANKISQNELAVCLGVGQSFISQIEKGARPMPKEYISKLLANKKWDTSMISHSKPLVQIHGLKAGELLHTPALNVRSAIEKATKADETLVGYLKLEIENLKAQISQLQNEKADLSKQVGMLEAKVELLSDGRLNVTFTPGDAK